MLQGVQRPNSLGITGLLKLNLGTHKLNDTPIQPIPINKSSTSTPTRHIFTEVHKVKNFEGIRTFFIVEDGNGDKLPCYFYTSTGTNSNEPNMLFPTGIAVDENSNHTQKIQKQLADNKAIPKPNDIAAYMEGLGIFFSEWNTCINQYTRRTLRCLSAKIWSRSR